MLLGQIAVKASLATYRSNKQPKLTSDFPLEFSIFNRTRNCCCPHWQFLHFQQNKKEFKLHPDYSGILEQIKPYNPVIRRQRSSLSPSPCLSSNNLSWMLVEKAIRGFDCKINGQNGLSSWPLGLVVLASTNTKHFWIWDSGCWQLLACLLKKCYHSWNTDLVQESKGFWWFVNFRLWPVTFFIWNENFHAVCENLLLIKVLPIALRNLSIIHWSLSINRT